MNLTFAHELRVSSRSSAVGRPNKRAQLDVSFGSNPVLQRSLRDARGQGIEPWVIELLSFCTATFRKSLAKVTRRAAAPPSDGARSKSASSHIGRSLPLEKTSIRNKRPKSVSKHSPQKMQPGSENIQQPVDFFNLCREKFFEVSSKRQVPTAFSQTLGLNKKGF